MWRSHFVVLKTMPSESSLERLAEGYQLFKEARTGLFYLTEHSAPLGRRPDFAGFLEREITHPVDVSQVKRLIADKSSALNVEKLEVSHDLIQRTVSLSKQLEMPVLAAEITDDDYAMAAMANTGTLEYLRVRTSVKRAADDEALVEMIYTPEGGCTIDYTPSEEIYGLGQTAISDVFNIEGVNLYNYCQQKPSREVIGHSPDQSRYSTKTELDSYGVFKRLSHASPRVTFAARILKPLRYSASFVALPFILTGMALYALIYSGNPKADGNVSVWRLFLLGLAALAIPSLIVICLLRAMLP